MGNKERKGDQRYHISLNGVLVTCKAFKKPCPRGSSVSNHFFDQKEGIKVADAVNEMLANKVNFDDEFHLVVSDGKGYAYGKSATTLEIFNSSDVYLKTLEKLRDEVKQKMYNRMYKDGIKKGVALNDDGSIYANISRIAPTTSKSVDSEKLEKEGLYGEYSKEIDVSEYISRQSKDKKLIRELKEKKATVLYAPFSFSKTEGSFDTVKKDTYTLTENASNTFKDYIELESKIEELKQTRDEAKQQLIHLMKEKGVTEIKGSESRFVYVPESVRTVVDTAKLKESGKYESFVKNVKRKGYIRKKVVA